jgi:hypothetical protein
MSTLRLLRAWLESRLDDKAATWLARASGEVSTGVDDGRFCALFSMASRYAPRGLLTPTEDERTAAATQLEGWNPERWTLLETVRVSLILSREDLDTAGIEAALEEAFKYPEMGEQCALYRSFAHLPDPARFAWRAGEGARTNMRDVFEAICCDTPYPVRWFDDVAWRQAVIKCIFIEAPLWRVFGLDDRLDAELARIALDLADERRSAGRAVNPELWMCLGNHSGERGLASLGRELEAGDSRGRAAAAIALVRAGERDRVLSLVAVENDLLVREAMTGALAGKSDQTAFAMA